MRHITFAVLACALMSSALAAERRWTRLYNGNDLSGWHVQEGKLEAWHAAGNRLTCGEGGGFLTTDRQYSDFELRLEYRIPPGGNSGIGLRYAPGCHPSSTAMEIQVLDDAAPEYRDLNPAQYNGSIYHHFPPTARPAKKAGEWNRLEIHCDGPRIRIRLNGTEVQNVNLAEHTEAKPGLPSPAQLPLRGCIGLQSHTGQIEFRNIEVRDL